MGAVTPETYRVTLQWINICVLLHQVGPFYWHSFITYTFFSVEITNKMQSCNRIYYSTVHWRLNMFRAAYRSPSGALTLFAAFGLHAPVVTGRSKVCVGTGQFPLRLYYGRSPQARVNQRLQIQLELPMMSDMPFETCWAFNERWNNKFYYKIASRWLFLLSHTAMHGSMNIKFILFFWLWRCDPTRVMAFSFLRFSRSHTTTHHSQ
jgi:hypothetical protein